MRMLNRNKQEFKFRNLMQTVTPILDDNGCMTGEYAPAYSDITTAYASITPAQGETSERSFGANVEYDRIICASTDLGMTENSQLWVDDLSSAQPDYIVKRIARSKNGVRVAVARVKISDAPTVDSM